MLVPAPITHIRGARSNAISGAISAKRRLTATSFLITGMNLRRSRNPLHLPSPGYGATPVRNPVITTTNAAAPSSNVADLRN